MEFISNLLTNYLSCRIQNVLFGGIIAPAYLVPHGVPQGSVLSPLLFNLYTSDISRIAHDRGLRCQYYADDT